MKYLGPAIACLALWLGAVAEVRAEPAPMVEIHGATPFDRSELEDALLPRLGDASIDTRAAARGALVQVRAGAAGVLVRVGTRERTVPLGERTGPGAARVVALVILDLMLSEGPALPMPLAPPPAEAVAEDAAEAVAGAAAATAPEAAPAPAPAAPAPTARPRPLAFAPPPPPPPVQAAPPAHAGPAVEQAPPGAAARPAPESMPVSRQVSRPAPRPGVVSDRAARMVRVSGFGGTVTGATSGDATMVSTGADVRLGLGSWRAGAGLSWLHLPVATYDLTAVALDGAALRLEAGRAFGELELTATAFAMPSRLRTDVLGSPSDHHDTLLFGGGAAIRAGARLGQRWRLIAMAGADVFGRRLRVRSPDEVITSTPLVTISLAVGVSWEVMP